MNAVVASSAAGVDDSSFVFAIGGTVPSFTADDGAGSVETGGAAGDP